MIRGDLQNKGLVVDTSSPTASMRTLKYLLADAAKHKAIFHQLYFIGELLKAKVMNRIFLKLDSRYTDNFPEYENYFERTSRLLNPMYGMNNSGNLFADKLTK